MPEFIAEPGTFTRETPKSFVCWANSTSVEGRQQPTKRIQRRYPKARYNHEQAVRAFQNWNYPKLHRYWTGQRIVSEFREAIEAGIVPKSDVIKLAADMRAKYGSRYIYESGMAQMICGTWLAGRRKQYADNKASA